MRRAFFFIVAVFVAASSFASIPRASMLDRATEDASAFVASLPETRIRVSDVLAPFERPAVSELMRALHQAYEQPSTTSVSGLRRFLSVDPEMNIGAIMRQPQAWNRYSYVVNNPINKTDPTGRCFWDVCVGEAVLAAATLTAATAYMVAPSNVVPGKNNGQVMVDTAIGGFQALGRAVGSLIPGRQPTSLPPPPAPTTPSRPSTPGTQATTGVNPAAPIQASDSRNPAQDKILSPGEIKILQNAGHDVHELKGGENASKYDLYKDTAGNIYVKPKGGKGPGEETGLNIKDKDITDK